MNGCPCQFVWTCFIPMHVGKPSSCKWLHHDYQGELLLVALGWFPFINGPSNLPSSHITPNGNLQGTHWIFHLYIYGYFIHCDETVKKVWFWYPFFCLVHCKHLKSNLFFSFSFWFFEKGFKACYHCPMQFVMFLAVCWENSLTLLTITISTNKLIN